MPSAHQAIPKLVNRIPDRADHAHARDNNFSQSNSSLYAHSTVDAQDFACDIVRTATGKKRGGFRNILRLSDPAQRNSGGERGGFIQPLCHIGPYETGCNGVAGDIFSGQLPGNGFG